jgi:hypothetical protein
MQRIGVSKVRRGLSRTEYSGTYLLPCKSGGRSASEPPEEGINADVSDEDDDDDYEEGCYEASSHSEHPHKCVELSTLRLEPLSRRSRTRATSHQHGAEHGLLTKSHRRSTRLHKTAQASVACTAGAAVTAFASLATHVPRWLCRMCVSPERAYPRKPRKKGLGHYLRPPARLGRPYFAAVTVTEAPGAGSGTLVYILLTSS